MDHGRGGWGSAALSASPASLAILRFGALGDVVLTTPVIDALATHWPDTRIVFVTKTAFADLLRPDPRLSAVESLAPSEGLGALRRRLLAHRPEAILDLHGKLRSRVLTASCPSIRSVRWKKRPLSDGLAVRMRWRTYRAEMLIAHRYGAAAARLADAELPVGRLKLFISDEDAERAAELLSARGRLDSKPLVGVAPGAKWWTKRWPEEKFADLTRRLAESGAQILLVGGPDERELAGRVADAASPAAIDLVGETSVSVLAALVARCDAFVANDSGPMHVARALGVPTLALFGSTDPSQFDFSGHAVMFAGEPCSPCSLYGLPTCPEQHFRCMQRLAVEDAVTRVESLVSRGRVAPVEG